MNTEDIYAARTIAHMPKEARKNYLDVFEQGNTQEADLDLVGDPANFGSATLIPDNNGRPKNNGPNQEMNADDFCTSTIVHVPKKACKRYLDVFEQHYPKRENENRVDDSGDHGSIVLFSNTYNGRPKNNRPMNDLDFLTRKRIIFSDDVTKTALVKHDEKLSVSNKERDDEDAETFFENLKKRINKDLQKNILQKTSNPSPQRLPKSRKYKRFLNNETRSLMNKFRKQFARIQSQKLLSQENSVFSMVRGNNSSTREECVDSEIPNRAVERGMMNDIVMEHHRTHNNSSQSTLSFHETDAEGYNHLPISPSWKRNTMFSMECRGGSSGTGENFSEHRHPTMQQDIVNRAMTEDISMKYFETNEDALRNRLPFNEILGGTHNRQLASSSSERNRAFSMERQSSSWTRENIREHRRPAMSQSIMESKPMKDILWEHCETDNDSLHSTLTFDEIDADVYNQQLTPSSSQRSGAVFIERRSNNSTRESICEHQHSAIAQNVVERAPAEDILEHFDIHEDSHCCSPSFKAIRSEAYDCLQKFSSTGSNTFVKYYTKKC